MGPESSGSARFGVWPLLLAHVLIALPLAYFLNVWADEASTLHTTQHGFVEAFRNAAANEKQAPLYFWVLSLWRSLNDSIFFARLFSIICSVAAIKLFAGLAARLFEPRAALLATAFFALHPFLIWASLEIRVYSLVILLSVLLMRLFLDAFTIDDQGASWRREIPFLVVALTALYTNYYLGFLLVGLFVALLMMKKWPAVRDYVLLMLVAGAAFVPMALSMVSQFAANTGGFQEPRSVVEGIRFLWHHFLTFVLPAGILFGDSDLAITTARLWIVRVALAFVAVLTVWRRSRLSRRTITTAAGVATIVCGLLAAYFLLGADYIAIRHLSVLFAPLLIFIVLLLADLFDESESKTRLGRAAIGAGGILVLLSFAYSLTVLHPHMTKRGDWERIGVFIEQNEAQMGQPIVVFPAFEALALPYHYHGKNRVLPNARFFDFEPQAEFGSPDSRAREIEYVISAIPRDSEGLWLAVSEECIISETCRPLENFVLANYTIEIEKDFYLERLYLLRKKQ